MLNDAIEKLVRLFNQMKIEIILSLSFQQQ